MYQIACESFPGGASSNAAAKHNDTGDRTAWQYQNVQSVAGGVLVFGDELHMFVSGRGWAANTCGAGMLKIRRDGKSGQVQAAPFRLLKPQSTAQVACTSGHWSV